MKNRSLPTLLGVLTLFILSQGSYAQDKLNEKGFSFQGYARNIDGSALSSKSIEVRFSIYPISSGTVEFTETQTTTTDAFGVFHLIIGSASTAEYQALDFVKNDDYKLKVETREAGTGSFATISDAELQSVPYAQAADNGVPVGSIIIFAGPKSNIPAGWLPCDGTAYAQSTYPKLHAAIGQSWGNGTDNGSGDFNVPDLRGFFLRGVNSGTGEDPDIAGRTNIMAGGNTGDAVGSYQSHAYVSHNHTASASASTEGAHSHSVGMDAANNDDDGFGDRFDNASGGITGTQYRNTSTIGAHDHTISVSVNSSGGNETRPENAYVWYIIRAR